MAGLDLKCPKCGSDKVSISWEMNASGEAVDGTMEARCGSCGSVLQAEITEEGVNLSLPDSGKQATPTPKPEPARSAAPEPEPETPVPADGLLKKLFGRWLKK
ncbi:MAG: TFIIB-type zinc ribbon-containing protein [Anaerolineae bacterium]|nr:TFIIB-type zinc ribbon-containing protein [Anaerolineae bacterium]